MSVPPPILSSKNADKLFNCGATGKPKDGGMDTAQQDLPSEVQEFYLYLNNKLKWVMKEFCSHF